MIADAPLTRQTATILIPNQQPKLGNADKEAKVANEFASVFLTQVVDEMLQTVDLGVMSGGHAEETWRSFLASAIADEIANSGATSISENVRSAIARYRAISSVSGE